MQSYRKCDNKINKTMKIIKIDFEKKIYENSTLEKFV